MSKMFKMCCFSFLTTTHIIINFKHLLSDHPHLCSCSILQVLYVSGLVWQTFFLRWPHDERSYGVRSGDLADHSKAPLSSNHLFRNTVFKYSLTILRSVSSLHNSIVGWILGRFILVLSNSSVIMVWTTVNIPCNFPTKSSKVFFFPLQCISFSIFVIERMSSSGQALHSFVFCKFRILFMKQISNICLFCTHLQTLSS